MKPDAGPELRLLRCHLAAIRRRIWLERMVGLEARALVIGFALATIAAAIAWTTFSRPEPAYLGGPVALALASGAVLSLFRYPSSMEAARAADRRLGLRERLGTAVELSRGGVMLGGPIARRQIAGAVEVAGWARENWRGGPPVGRQLGLAAALGLLAAGLLLLSAIEERLPAPIPRPSVWSLLPGGAPAAEQPWPSEPLEVAGTPDRASARPGSSRTAAVVRSLDELRTAREAGAISSREAANRLSEIESELNRQTRESRGQREALDRLGQALDQVAAGRAAAEAIQAGDYQAAAREIADLGTESDQLSPQAKAQLAQGLRSAAAETPAAPDLAARERRAADALAGRDYEAARRAMQDLADDVARRGSEVVPRAELSQAWEQVDAERRAQGQGEPRRAAQPQDRGAPDAPGASQSRPGQASASTAGSGAGSQPGGEGGEGTAGAGDGGENAAPPGAGAPGEPSLGEFQPAGQAARLDVQGRPVEVDVRPGERPGRRPGDADEPPNEQPTDGMGSIATASGEASQRINSAAPAESNFVPRDRRLIVRDYFSSASEANR